MTEKRPEDREIERKRRTAAERQEFADELNCTKLEAFDRVRQRFKDNWEAVNKALYTLILGHAAGLVACMTLLKEPGSLKGAGTFITVFGLGFLLAVVSAAIWIVGRYNYWVFPFTGGKRWYNRHDIRDWLTAAFALISTVLMALASAIAVCKFGTL